MAEHTLYINAQFGNEATLDTSMSAEIDRFGWISWKTLLTEVLHEDLDWLLQEGRLMDRYGIEAGQLDEQIEDETVERHYSDISCYWDNTIGAGALAFEFIRSLQLFPMDADGNGAAMGVCLEQSTANGPRKVVYVEDEDAMEWLAAEFANRGLGICIKTV